MSKFSDKVDYARECQIKTIENSMKSVNNSSELMMIHILKNILLELQMMNYIKGLEMEHTILYQK
jgi:hypothetical protein